MARSSTAAIARGLTAGTNETSSELSARVRLRYFKRAIEQVNAFPAEREDFSDPHARLNRHRNYGTASRIWRLRSTRTPTPFPTRRGTQ
jgi:hypothetical protein